MPSDEIEVAIRRLIPGLRENDALSLAPVPGGANNKLYRAKTAIGDYIIKNYFRHSADKRDRLNAEFSFASFAWRRGIRCIAEPIACDRDLFLGAYRFIEGKKLDANEISWHEIEQALQFFTKINRYKGDEDAIRLSTASEACFTIEEHIQTIDARLKRLEGITGDAPLEREASRFVKNDLLDTWQVIRTGLISASMHNGMSLAEKLSADNIVISPSDFGFHNALLVRDDAMAFIDFEYAGWDDPAKMVCDFFSQVAVPIPMIFFDRFAESVARSTQEPQETRARIRLLLPAYRLKWCCIVLNHFLPVDRARKHFADRHSLNKRESQLAKAKILLGTLKTSL